MCKWNERIIDKMIQGDERAQATCYSEYSKVIYTAIFKICKNKEHTSDLLQDTFIDAFNNIGSYNRSIVFVAWLKRIAFNNTFNFIKREKTRAAAVEQLIYLPVNTSKTNEVIDQKNLLDHLMSNVTLNERLILWLFVVEQYSHDEIAEIMNKSPSYSKSIVSRCLKKLRKTSKASQYAY